jgi:hypothetical protein
LSEVGVEAQASRVAWNPPTYAAGPCSTQERAKQEAARANARHGGPGFLVADRDGVLVADPDGDLTPTPHAYFAEQSPTGEWYAALKEMPSARMTLVEPGPLGGD